MMKNIKLDIKDNKAIKYIYSRSASIFSQIPDGVFFPKNRDDIKEIISYVQKKGLSIIPKGAGTSRSGQDINSSIVVDMSKYFNKILEFDDKTNILKVQSGTTLKEINSFLEKRDLFFPPDPSSGDYITIGGMLGNNSGGARALKYGVMRDYVTEVEVILADREIYSFPKDNYNDKFKNLKDILDKNRRLIIEKYPTTIKNSSGYNLKNIFVDSNIDLTPLFISSEGTIAIVTEISLKVLPILKKRKNFILTATTLNEVIELVSKIKKYTPEKIELVDKDILKLAKLDDKFVDKIVNSNYQYILLVSFSSNSKIEIEELLNSIKLNLLKVDNEDEYEKMFKLRKTAAGYIHRTRERGKPIPVIEDLQVEFNKFELFTNGIKNILKKYSIDAFFFGHIGDGNIHINTFFDILKREDREKANILRREVHRFIISIDGNLSGEHGDGKLRSIDLENLYPELYPIFKKIKYFFDYNNIFNPNNIIVVDKKSNPFDNLRLNLDSEYRVPKWLNDYFYISEIEACNGCGKCRDYCPSFKANGDERYTTRARLTLFQGLIGGDFELDEFKYGKKNGVKEIIDSCIGCHICASECPTGVDAGKLIFKLKAILDEDKPISEKIVKENHLIGTIGQKTAPISNILLNSKIGKILNEKILGFDRKIVLPKFKKSKINIEKYLIDENQLEFLSKNSVVYFSGCFANYYSTDSEFYSTIKVLEFFNFKPYLIDFKCCGISKINSGISIKDDATKNIELFNKITKYNIPIIFTAPSCKEAVVELYPFLNRKWNMGYIDNIYDIFTFLKLNVEFDKFKIKSIDKKSIQYHPPCHTRKTTTSKDVKYILEKVGYDIELLPENCCGMAGTFGNYKKNIEKSLKIGEKQLSLIDKNSKEVITGCGTCQIQIKTHTSQTVDHPIKYLFEILSID